jgi:hypothetical protein
MRRFSASLAQDALLLFSLLSGVLAACSGSNSDRDPYHSRSDITGQRIVDILKPRQAGSGPLNRSVSLSGIANCSGPSCSRTIGLTSITDVVIDPRRQDIFLIGSDAGRGYELPLDSLIEFIRMAKKWSDPKARPLQTLIPPNPANPIFDAYNVRFEPADLADSSAGSAWLDADIFLKYLIVHGFDGVPPLAEIEQQHILNCDFGSAERFNMQNTLNYYFFPAIAKNGGAGTTIEWRRDAGTSVWNGTLNTTLRLAHGEAEGGVKSLIAEDFTDAVNNKLAEMINDAPILQDDLNTFHLWDIAYQLTIWSGLIRKYQTDQAYDYDKFVDRILDRLIRRYAGGHVTPRKVATWAQSRSYGRQCHMKKRVNGQEVFVEFVAGRGSDSGGMAASSGRDGMAAVKHALGDDSGLGTRSQDDANGIPGIDTFMRFGASSFMQQPNSMSIYSAPGLFNTNMP